MFIRLVITVVSIVALIVGSPGMAMATDDDDWELEGLNDRTRKTDPIWEGLCVGASLDLSRESEIKCARQAQAAKENARPAKPPNIEQGLCVGASLDLSLASQKRCARSTSSSSNHTDKHRTTAPKTSTDKKPAPPPQDTTKDRPPAEDSTPTPSQVPVPGHAGYAALGDSVAAGLGLNDSVGDSEICGRTFEAYVYEVASSRGMHVTHLACSGATMGDLFTQQGVSGPSVEPQLDIAFINGTPELITITAGANDIHWDDFLRKCYSGTCGTSSDERIASGLLAVLDVKMQFVFSEIERRSSGSPPEVIMTGYYNPLSDSCAELEPRLTLDEIAWLDEQTALLNQALEDTARQYSFVDFVPLDFSGHDICSSDPWIQTLDDPAPFHPTVEGQQAIARAIL